MRSRKVILLLGSSESVDHQAKYLLALSSKESVPDDIQRLRECGSKSGRIDQAVVLAGIVSQHITIAFTRLLPYERSTHATCLHDIAATISKI